MKHLYSTILFLFILYLSLSCTPTSSKYSKEEQTNSQQEIKVDFCKLLDNANVFDGQEVQTTAILLIGFERAFLYDPNCVSEKRLVWFEVEDAPINEKLNSYLVPDSPEYTSKGVIRVKVDILGKFQTKRDKGFGHLNASNYLFSITEIKKLDTVPMDIPYPW